MEVPTMMDENTTIRVMYVDHDATDKYDRDDIRTGVRDARPEELTTVDEVTVDATDGVDLEEVYLRYQGGRAYECEVRSMSAGDVIVIDDNDGQVEAHKVARVGFERIEVPAIEEAA